MCVCVCVCMCVYVCVCSEMKLSQPLVLFIKESRASSCTNAAQVSITKIFPHNRLHHMLVIKHNGSIIRNRFVMTPEEEASLLECVQGKITFIELIERHSLNYERAHAIRNRKNRMLKARGDNNGRVTYKLR